MRWVLEKVGNFAIYRSFQNTFDIKDTCFVT